jgi:hypothetical protein
MEVEIEDLHLQIDDIAKAKTAVRVQGVHGRAGKPRENKAMISAAFIPKRSLHTRAFFRTDSDFPSSAFPHLGQKLGGRACGKGSQPKPISLFSHLPAGAWLQAPAP